MTDPPLSQGSDEYYLAMVANIRKRTLTRDQDVCIAVTGAEGSGKSTFALKLAKSINPTFSASQICFDDESLLEQVQTAPKGNVILFDEAVNGLYARESMSTENRVITTAAMIARARNLVWILCIPSLHNLDIYFRNHRILIWAYIMRNPGAPHGLEGEAFIHQAKRNPYHADTWWKLVLRYQYGKLDGPSWDAYRERKMDYISQKLLAGSERKRRK